MASALNDIVYKTAKKYGADVLELRHIFTSSEDTQILLSHLILVERNLQKQLQSGLKQHEHLYSQGLDVIV